MTIFTFAGSRSVLAKVVLLLGLGVAAQAFASGGTGIPLQKAPINPQDHASLQRGARLYMNYCVGCHSLRYMRYNRMATDIGISDAQGAVNQSIVEKNLIFTGAKIAQTINNAMDPAMAKNWFGVAPPDLTLAARVRGVDWLYTYLRSFYLDPTRPYGVNNLLFDDVAMPNVMAELQGNLVPVYAEKTVKINGKTPKRSLIDHLTLQKKGIMSPTHFDLATADLVNFLAYVGEPMKADRERIGIWVLLFLAVLFVFAFLLKKEYWKDVKKTK